MFIYLIIGSIGPDKPHRRNGQLLLFIHSFIHSFIYLFVCLFVCLFIYLFIFFVIFCYPQDTDTKYFHVKGKQKSSENWSSYSVQLPFDVPPSPYTKDGKKLVVRCILQHLFSAMTNKLTNKS